MGQLNPRVTADGVAFVRTPDENFADLAGYPFAPNYLEVQGLRLHYVDAGPRDGPTVLLLHGMPTWSYLNRILIARLTAAGYRCVAPDHMGFGRSDKPTSPEWYSIQRHREVLATLIQALDLRDVTLCVQDWGGPIGLAQAVDQPDRFARLVVMNTWLHHDGFEYTAGIRRWQAFWRPGGMLVESIPAKTSLGWMMTSATRRMPLGLVGAMARGEPPPQIGPDAEAVRRAYDAPFAGLGEAGLAGPRRFPLCIPIDDGDSAEARIQAAHFEALLGWRKPIHFVWGGDDDVFVEAWGRAWAARYPQATFDLIPQAGHFLQDQCGEEVASFILDRISA